jgi:DNA-binding CsgD family transcriptional regulator
MRGTRPSLTGRSDDRLVLEELLEHAQRHGTVTGLVTGPARVGKTALVEAFLDTVESDRVLRARGLSWEAECEFGVLGQLLPGVEATSCTPPAADLLGASKASVVVVDDAQWCDRSTLQTLGSFAVHHRSANLLILLVGRDGESRTSTAGREDDLLQRLADRVLRVRPLAPSEVSRLAAQRGVILHHALADQLCRHTSGIPARVLELLEELPRDTWAEADPVLPPTEDVRQRIGTAMISTSAAARALAEAVAVLGASADLSETAALAGLEDPLAPLYEAEDAGLVTPTQRHGRLHVELEGPMAAAAVLESLGPRRRTALHVRAADMLTDPERQLHHRVAAAPLPDPQLADRLAELAEVRATEGAWSVASDLFVQASRMSTDAIARESRLLRGVDAMVGAGDVPRAAAYLAEVESLRETPMRNAVLAYLAIVRGRAGEAETRLARAWELVNPDRDPGAAAVISQRYVLHCLAQCRGAELVSWAERAAHLSGQDSTAGVEAQAILGLGLLGAGRPDEALAQYVDLSQLVTHGAQAQRIQMGQGWLHLALDRVDEAVAELESAVPTTFQRGSVRISLWASAWLARAQFVSGEWGAALHTVNEALDLAERSGMRLITPLLHWSAAQVHALRGDWPLAEQSLQAGEAGPADYLVMQVPSRLAHAHLAEARADYRGVLRALAPLTHPSVSGDVARPGLWPWPDVYANALVIEGRLGDAEAFLDHHEHSAEESGHPSALARLGYPRGRLLGALGRIDEARAVFERSITVLDDLPLRHDRARAYFAFGQTLRRAGKRREADAAMKVARDLYAGLGATTYVLRCDRELKAGGVHASPSERAFDDLTPQENAISELVARGLSNREVAAELFLSPKTIQYHLTRVYGKLGIRSRTELAALRGRDGEQEQG